MYQLVCSGYSRPGQTGWSLIDSFTLDVVLDLAYGALVKDLDPEQCKQIDDQLKKLDEDEGPVVEKVLSDGRVVKISEARLARILANQGGIHNMTRKKRG